MDPFKTTREARAYFSLLPSCQMIQEKCKAVTCPKATSKWPLHSSNETYIAHHILTGILPLSMPNLEAQIRATEAANSQMFAWQANHLAKSFNFRGRKTHKKIAGHRRINRKNGKMSAMFPALFIQIHWTSTTECITFAKFSIQMTSWMIHIAMQALARLLLHVSSLIFITYVCFSTNPKIALAPNGNNRNNDGNLVILRFSGRKNRQDFFEIFLPPSPWDDGGTKLEPAKCVKLVFFHNYDCTMI